MDVRGFAGAEKERPWLSCDVIGLTGLIPLPLADVLGAA